MQRKHFGHRIKYIVICQDHECDHCGSWRLCDPWVRSLVFFEWTIFFVYTYHEPSVSVWLLDMSSCTLPEVVSQFVVNGLSLLTLSLFLPKQVILTFDSIFPVVGKTLTESLYSWFVSCIEVLILTLDSHTSLVAPALRNLSSGIRSLWYHWYMTAGCWQLTTTFGTLQLDIYSIIQLD